MNQPPAQSEAIGQSDVFLSFQESLSQMAKVDRPVLLIGERGTGKELAVERLHYLSARWNDPLVTLHCAALSPNLIESELFGHEAGAFTGARTRKVGRFESAHGGTLFLDEIGLVPLPAQEKILRVVEYGVFERVGGNDRVEVDVRIVGATHADMPLLVEQGKFKADLLDRLSFAVLFVPPLRERHGDISLLTNFFARRMAQELEWEERPEFSMEALQTLESYAWPGNIRELKNVVERAVFASESACIAEIQIDPFVSPYHATGQSAQELPSSSQSAQSKSVPLGWDIQKAVTDTEIDYLRRALQATQYHQTKAAKLLGLTYNQFRGLYRKYKDLLD